MHLIILVQNKIFDRKKMLVLNNIFFIKVKYKINFDFHQSVLTIDWIDWSSTLTPPLITKIIFLAITI